MEWNMDTGARRKDREMTPTEGTIMFTCLPSPPKVSCLSTTHLKARPFYTAATSSMPHHHPGKASVTPDCAPENLVDVISTNCRCEKWRRDGCGRNHRVRIDSNLQRLKPFDLAAPGTIEPLGNQVGIHRRSLSPLGQGKTSSLYSLVLKVSIIMEMTKPTRFHEEQD